MPSLNDILCLDKTQSTIKKIDLFLSSHEKNSYEYVKAVSFKATILDSLGKTNDALKLVYSFVPEFRYLEPKSIVELCNVIIDISITNDKYDQAIKYIALKKNYLAVSESSEYYKDQIRLFLKMDDKVKTLEIVKKFLDDDITKEEEIYAKEILSRLYFDNKEYDNYLEIIKPLEDYYKDNIRLESLKEINFNKILINYERNKYIDVINEGNKFLTDNNDDPKYSLKCATILIKTYLICSDNKRASIIESRYADLLIGKYIDEEINFCYAAIDLYNKINSVSSIKEYHEKLRELEELKKPIVKSQPKKNNKTPIKEEIIIPEISFSPEQSSEFHGGLLNPKIETKVVNEQIINRVTGKIDINLSEDFLKLSKIFEDISCSNLDTKFRELFRNACIELTKEYKIDEVYILYYDKKYLGLHYKKERAYDKLIDIDEITNTVNYVSYLNDKEVFLNKNDRVYNQNILTNLEYDENINAFAMPLHNDVGVIASIAFISYDDFLNQDLCYEALKLLSNIISVRLNMEIKNNQLEYQNLIKLKVLENFPNGIKIYANDYIHFNDNAINMTGAIENMKFLDYVYMIDKEYQAKYRQIHNDTLNHQHDNEITYTITNDGITNYIKESMYPLVYDNSIYILSILENKTAEIEEKNNLKDIAYLNPISKVNTELKLILDINEIINEDYYSIISLEVIDFKLYEDLYGINFTNQLIYALGLKLKEAIQGEYSFSLYHLDRDRFVFLAKDIIDKRVLQSKLVLILSNASKNLDNLNKRLKILFNVGVYKKGKGINILEPYEALNYALDALNDAKMMDDIKTHIAFYDNELSKKRFYDNNLVTTISEGIDKGKIAISYQQIVNLTNKSLYGFMLKLTLDSYEIEYDKMYEVIKRKNLVKEMDKYLIINAFKELKMLKDSIGYALFYLPLHEELFCDFNINFFKKQLTFYKINPKYIVLIFNKCNIKYIKELKQLGFLIATTNIFDIYLDSVDYLFYDYNLGGLDSIKDIYDLVKLHDKEIIINNVNTKEDMLYMKNNNFDLIYGNYYKNVKRIKDIIESFK